jgi:hypothetical protein
MNKNKLVEIITALPIILLFGIFGFLMYLSIRSEKVAEWEEVCEVISIEETTQKNTTQTTVDKIIYKKTVVSFMCDMGPVMGERIFVQHLENNDDVAIHDTFKCFFEAWEIANAGSIAGPGPITKHSELKFKGCKK